MTEFDSELEKKKVRDIVRDYGERGFDVVVHPRGRNLPSFMREMDYEPDVIAKSSRENFVFEIASHGSKEKLARLSEIATLVNDRKKWQFVLVMTNPRESRIPRSYEAADIDNLEQQVASLRELIALSENQFNDVVLIKAWALYEAVLRLMDIDNLRVGPRSLVRNAVMIGVISRAEADYMFKMADLRNRIVHGFVVPDITKSKIEKLLKIVKRLASEATDNNTLNRSRESGEI